MTRYRRALLALAVFALAIVPAVAYAAAPANDNFADAQALDPSFGQVSGDNTDATSEDAAAEPDHASSGFGPAHSVWYRWHPAADSSNTFDTCGSSFDTRIAIYVGTGLGSLSQIAANDDSSGTQCAGTKASEATSFFSAGTDYYIAVDTMGPLPSCDPAKTRGPFRLRLNGSGASDQLACPGATTTPPTEQPPTEQPPTEQPPTEQPPTEQPPTTDDGKTTPATPVPLRTVRVKVPRLIANCGDDTPRFGEHCTKGPFEFATSKSVDSFLKRMATLKVRTVLVTPEAVNADEAKNAAQTKWLREHGVGGEITNAFFRLANPDGSDDRIEQGRKYDVASNQRIFINYSYFDLARDKRALEDAEAELRRQAEREARNNQKPKSKCMPIAAGLTKAEIFGRFVPDSSGYRPFLTMFDGLRELGCQVTFTYDDKGDPTVSRSYVKEVVSVDEKDDSIKLLVVEPRAHDFVFVIREEPKQFYAQPNATIPIGTDGQLTVSEKQNNRFTVQVVERATGRLVSGIPVTFYGAAADKKHKDQTIHTTHETDANGEWTFTPYLVKEGDYRLTASFGDMEGSVTLHAANRGASGFTSMAGRAIARSSKGLYSGADPAQLELARQLPAVPAMLATGKAGEVASLATIHQADVIQVDQLGNEFTGKYNAALLPNDSQALVGAAAGAIVVGGGVDGQAAARTNGRAGLGNPLELFGALAASAAKAWDDGVANMKSAWSAAEKALFADSARMVGQLSAGLISDKGLGVIATGGGNVISVGGANVISVGGGNLIGPAGGNSPTGVIATGGGNALPVHGGRVLSSNSGG